MIEPAGWEHVAGLLGMVLLTVVGSAVFYWSGFTHQGSSFAQRRLLRRLPDPLPDGYELTLRVAALPWEVEPAPDAGTLPVIATIRRVAPGAPAEGSGHHQQSDRGAAGDRAACVACDGSGPADRPGRDDGSATPDPALDDHALPSHPRDPRARPIHAAAIDSDAAARYALARLWRWQGAVDEAQATSDLLRTDPRLPHGWLIVVDPFADDAVSGPTFFIARITPDPDVPSEQRDLTFGGGVHAAAGAPLPPDLFRGGDNTAAGAADAVIGAIEHWRGDLAALHREQQQWNAVGTAAPPPPPPPPAAPR